VSMEWPIGYSGRYYWGHTYYVDTDDWLTFVQMEVATSIVLKSTYTADTTGHGQRYETLDGVTEVYRRQYITPNPGGQLAVANPSLLVAARWTLTAPDGSTFKHLHRRPVGVDDLEYGEWTAAGLLRQRASMGNVALSGIFRTKTGDLITGGRVDAAPTMWQLRHGTKRRTNRLWWT